MKMNNKAISILVLCLLILGLLFTACVEQEGKEEEKKPEKSSLSIATARVGGAFYSMGQDMVNLINHYLPDIIVTTKVTNGSVENCRLVGQQEADLGIANSNLVYFATNGMDVFDKKISNLLAIGNLHPSALHIVVLESSSSQSFYDLKGKKVVVGPAGGSAIAVLKDVFQAYGLTIEDINAQYLPLTEGFMQLSEGNVDAVVFLGGRPSATVIEFALINPIRLIPLGEDAIREMTSQYPYYNRSLIGKDVYELDQDYTTLAIDNLLFCDKDLDEELVYELTKSIYDHLQKYGEMNENAKQIDVASMDKTAIPLHPGAKRYHDERKPPSWWWK